MEFASIQDFEKGTGKAIHGTDKNLLVEFFNVRIARKHAPLNPNDPTLGDQEVIALANENGELLYDNVPHIRIVSPGNKTTQQVRPADLIGNYANLSDPRRFPKQWEQFQKGEEQKANGHLLGLIGLGDNEIKKFSEYHVYTVEHLLNVPDGLLSEIVMGARSIRDNAKKWLENKLKEEALNGEKDIRLEALEEKVNNLISQLHKQIEEKERLQEQLNEATQEKRKKTKKSTEGEDKPQEQLNEATQEKENE